MCFQLGLFLCQPPNGPDTALLLRRCTRSEVQNQGKKIFKRQMCNPNRQKRVSICVMICLKVCLCSELLQPWNKTSHTYTSGFSYAHVTVMVINPISRVVPSTRASQAARVQTKLDRHISTYQSDKSTFGCFQDR